MDGTGIWLTWERQRRNHTLSAALGARLNEFVFEGGMGRYVRSAAATAAVIARERPRVVFTQNPSLVLCLLALLLRRTYGYRLIVDAHNAGLYPMEGKSRVLNALARYVARSADRVIVTNPSLERVVAGWGGRPVVLPDPLPDLPPRRGERGGGTPFHVVFVCRWAADEPYREVLAAASHLGAGFRISITGKPPASLAPGALPPNVTLTGFLPEGDYVALLQSADAVLVLTTRENCLNCGAYEAVSLERPLVLSDTSALRSYFGRGALFTDNDAESIAAALVAARGSAASLGAAVAVLKGELAARWALLKEKAMRDIFLPGGG